MLRKETRRIDRSEFPEEVRLSWEEAGSRKYARGSGRDLSATGMSVQVNGGIPLRTQVRIESPRFKMPKFATVRHCTAKGPRFLLGLEFRD